jgi:succinate-acetate transporter protein
MKSDQVRFYSLSSDGECRTFTARTLPNFWPITDSRLPTPYSFLCVTHYYCSCFADSVPVYSVSSVSFPLCLCACTLRTSTVSFCAGFLVLLLLLMLLSLPFSVSNFLSSRAEVSRGSRISVISSFSSRFSSAFRLIHTNRY